MAFGEYRGNRWLLVPALGIALVLLSLSGWLPDSTSETQRFESECFGVGVSLIVVGIVLAGLVGHVVWLVPFAILLSLPLLLLSPSLLKKAGKLWWRRGTPPPRCPIEDHRDDTARL